MTLTPKLAKVMKSVGDGLNVADVNEADRKALELLRRRWYYVAFVRKHGEEPPAPKRSTKPVENLQPGDIVLLHVKGFDRSYEVTDVAVRPEGVHVLLNGCRPLAWHHGALMTVLDGPIRKRPFWTEYVLTDLGETALLEFEFQAEECAKDALAATAVPAVSPKPSDFTADTLPAEYRDKDGEPLTRKHIEKHPDWGPYATAIFKSASKAKFRTGTTGPPADVFLRLDVLDIYYRES
ncbi:MAG: hypothetical protein AB7Q45_25980 [Planctomycetaceae bacterium]